MRIGRLESGLLQHSVEAARQIGLVIREIPQTGGGQIRRQWEPVVQIARALHDVGGIRGADDTNLGARRSAERY